VLCLVDHPAVSAATVQKLVESFVQSRSPVVIPTHQGQRGHPVLISAGVFPELLSLGPEAGANTIIRKYREATQCVEVEDANILLDVDDPETFRRMQAE